MPNCLSQENIQIYSRPFFDRRRSFRFDRKNVIKNEKLSFAPKSMRDKKKMFVNKIVRLKNIYKLTIDYFFTGVKYFILFIQNNFIRNKNSIFPTKYTRYGKNVKKQNCFFQNI